MDTYNKMKIRIICLSVEGAGLFIACANSVAYTICVLKRHPL